MFITTPMNQVIAIDARSGNLLWRYRRPRHAGATVPHETNRGIALYGDKVYYAAGEAVLVALDAKTGKEVWTTEVAANHSSYYTTRQRDLAERRRMEDGRRTCLGHRKLRILIDYQRNGRTIKGLVDVARDGYVWFLDRMDRIRFVEAKPYV